MKPWQDRRWWGLLLVAGAAVLVLVADQPDGASTRSAGLAAVDVDFGAEYERHRLTRPTLPPRGTYATFAAADPLDTFGDTSVPRTPSDLRTILADADLPPARIREVLDLGAPAYILANRDRGGGSIDGGATQVGGLPLLPPEAPWPHREGVPLSLVVQIDLDAAPSGLDGRIPEDGILQVFEDLEAQLDDPVPVVLHHPDRSILEQRTTAVATWGQQAVRMDFEPILSVPNWGERVFAHWEDEERERYRDALPEHWVIDQVGGWPFEFQGDPAMMLGGADPSAWRLLVQLEVAPGDSMWGDAGVKWYMDRGGGVAAGVTANVRGTWASH